MANLPRSVDGWVNTLRQGWPRRVSPSQLSRGLLSLTRRYLKANTASRGRLRNAVKQLCGDELMDFAHRFAERAVQREDKEILPHALAALALGSEWIDPRDILTAFSLISHSSEKLTAGYRNLFKAARDYGGPDFAELIDDWLDREKYDRDIDGMGYKEHGAGKRFRYVDEDDDLGSDE